MKKVYLFVAMLLVALTACATNGFFFANAVNDSLRIKPNVLGGYATYSVNMQTEAFCDFFHVGLIYPEYLRPKTLYGIRGIEAGEGMTVGYIDRNGMYQTYDANLNVGSYYESVTGYIPEDGYWDYNHDGLFESYGTIKWEHGTTADMFVINFWVDENFRKGWVVFDMQFGSGSDRRGPVLGNVYAYKETLVWVGYLKGDVTGNERINIDDVSTLIAFLLDDIDLDEFEREAADVDCDGHYGINDVATLINKLLK